MAKKESRLLKGGASNIKFMYQMHCSSNNLYCLEEVYFSSPQIKVGK